MWWGGGDEDPPSGGSSSENTTPPIDIMAEEASFRGDSPSSFTSTSVLDEDVADLPDLKDQFAMQESLLGHLKSVLKCNEEKLQAKEKEVQDYAIRLSKSKRSKMTSPLTRSVDSVFTSSPLFIPQSEGARKPSGKLSMLKKQLEEQRVKENEEIQSRQGLEYMVKQLQKELEERDNLISQLHEQMSVASFQTSPIHSPYVMSPGNGSPTGDQSPDRTPPLGCSIDSAASGFFSSHYKSFSDKDNKIIELTEKNIELERKLLDIEENLRAKEELIRAKTAAVTLMSADLSAKGKSTLDQLEDTRTEMRKMQANFAEQEAQWREKTSCLQVELESKDKRLKSLEEFGNRTEKVRFELMTKNAELQEKIVHLQSNLSDLKERREEETKASRQLEEKLNEKITALERVVEIAERSKTDKKEELVEALKSITSDEQLAEKIVELENRLAELEEEKGNLQLRLVDYEDIASADSATKDTLNEVLGNLKKNEIEMSELKHELAAAVKENEGLIQAVNDRDLEILEMTSKVESLLTTNEELSLSKVKLEMKSVELEEQKDRLEDERKELIENITQSRKCSEETVKNLIDVQRAHTALNSKMEALEAEHAKCRTSQRLHDEDMLEKAETIKELRISLNQLEKVLHDKNVEMSDFVVASEESRAEKSSMTAEIHRLTELVSAREDKIAELKDLLEESKVEVQISNLMGQLQTVQANLEDSNLKIATLEGELIASRENCDRMMAELKSHEIKEERYKAATDELDERITAFEEELCNVKKQRDTFEAKSCELEETNKAFKEKLALNVVQVDELTTQLNGQSDVVSQKNEAIESLESKIYEMKESMDELTQIKLDLEEKLSLVQSQKGETEQNSIEYASKIGMLEKREQELQLENVNLTSKLEQLHASEGEWAAKVISLKEEIDQLKNEKLQQENILSEQAASLLEANEKVLNLQNQKSSLEQEMEAIRLGSGTSEESSVLRSKISSLESECDSMKEEMATMEVALSESHLKLAQLESQLSETLGKLQVQQENKSKTEDGNEGWDSPTMNICVDCDSIRNEKVHLENSLSEKDSQLEVLKLQLVQVTDNLRALEEAHSCLNEQSQVAHDEPSSDWDAQDIKICEECSKLSCEKMQLELEISGYITRHEQLKSQLDASEENLKDLQEHYDALKSLMAAKESPSAVAASGDPEKLKAKCDLLTDKCKKLLAKCKQQEATIKELQAAKEVVPDEEPFAQGKEAQQMADEVTQLQEQLQAMSARLIEVEGQLSESFRQVSSLEDEVSSSHQLLSTLKEELASKEAELQSCRQKSDSGWDKESIAPCEECERMAAEKSALEQQITDHTSRIGQLEAQLENEKVQRGAQGDLKNPDYDKVKAKCDLLTEKCKKLLAKCKQQETTIKAYESAKQPTAGQGESDAQGLNDTIKSLEAQVTELRAQLDSSSNSLLDDGNHQVYQLQEVQAKLQETIQQVDCLQGQLDSSSEIVANLREKLSAQEKKELDLTTAIKKLNFEVDDYTREVDTLTEEKLKLEARCKELDSCISELQTADTKRSSLLNEQAVKLDAQIETIAQKSERIQAQELEIQSLQEHFNSVYEELKAARNEANELKAIAEQIRSEKLLLEQMAGQKDDLEALTSERIERIATLEANLEELLQEKQNLLLNVEQMKQSEQEWSIKVAHLQEECNHAISERTRAENEAAELSLRANGLQYQLESVEENLKVLQLSFATSQEDYDCINSKCLVQEETIHQLTDQISLRLAEVEQEREQRLKLQDQVDSLTIVAENLRSIQDQVHLKDGEIEALRNELESVREQLQEQVLQGEAAGNNRPPPDVTQYQLNPSQPDIATFQVSQQPDLMPGVSFQQQASPFDLVQDQNLPGGDWDNDWRDGGNAANWFDNMQPVEDMGQQVEAAPENEADIAEVENLQRALEAKQSECAALITEVDALVCEKSTLEAKIQDLKSDKESMQEKMTELETSLLQQQRQQQQFRQSVQSQPDTAEKTTETSGQPIEVPTRQIEQQSEQDMAQSPPPNVFTWDSFIETSAEAQHASDFFVQQVGSSSQLGVQPSLASNETTEKIKELELKLKLLEDEHSQCHVGRNQIKVDWEADVAKFELQIQALHYEKAMLEDQINQLPTMDAFNSLHKVNEELSEETAQLKERLEVCGEFNALKATNEELKMKLASIAESQNEAYEANVRELKGQIEALTQQLLDLQNNFQQVSAQLEEQLAKAAPLAPFEEGTKVVAPTFTFDEAQSPIIDSFSVVPSDPVKAGNDNLLGAQDVPVEKGFSASSYFDQIGSSRFDPDIASPTADISVFETVNQQDSNNADPQTAVFDAFGFSQPSIQTAEAASQEPATSEYVESVEWYKSQLEQYQQAIADWQTWSETQLQEVNSLKESVAHYTDAYNALNEEHGKCNSGNEVTSLRAAVKAKDIEVQDLTETVDRLQTEKSELEQEITDLTFANQELKRERDERAPAATDSFDLALYEDTRQNLEENMDKLRRASDELAVKRKELIEASREKDEAVQQLGKLQSELSELKNELEAVKESKSKEVDELTNSNKTLNDTITQLTSELAETKQMLDDAQANLNAASAVSGAFESTVPESSNVDNAEELARLKDEMAQQKTVIEDWNAWGQQKTEEYNTLLQAYNQYVESYNNLTEEASQLKAANETLNQEITSMKTLLGEKEAELAQKVAEVVATSQQEPLASQAEILSTAFESDKGWGTEEDVLQGQVFHGSSDNAILELEAEISELKTKLREEHDEKVKLNEEINAAKVKHGKLTLKVKQLTKELQSRKSASPASSSATGDDSLDKAIMDEMNTRAQKAEKALKDAQQLIKDLSLEKSKLSERVDTLEGGNERFLELKEAQDQEVQHLRLIQQDLLGKVGGFEWQLSEKDEHIADLEQQLNIVNEQLRSSGNGDAADQLELRSEVTSLRRNLSEMESNCMILTSRVEELESSLLQAKSEKEDIALQLIDAQDKYDSMLEEYELLKNISSQFEALQAKLELMESSKEAGSSPGGFQQAATMIDYENFHSLNQTMQQEILSLRAYIEQQQVLIQELQMRQQASGEADQDQQVLASLVFERNRVRQLEKDLQNKDTALQNVLRELESSTRVRHESASSMDRETEVRKLFGETDTDLLMQNERLKYDLDKSVVERKLLSQQMENWKRQLTDSDDLPSEDEEERENPEVIKMKQEQAYRSVGALQLRVEELTLEVTKLLEERDTLQLKLSNVMRQYERHKESTSRASTACSTPIPWVESTVEVKELKQKIDELSKLNYSLDIELQKERGNREQMQAKLRLHGTPKRTLNPRRPSEDRTDSPVLHI